MSKVLGYLIQSCFLARVWHWEVLRSVVWGRLVSHPAPQERVVVSSVPFLVFWRKISPPLSFFLGLYI